MVLSWTFLWDLVPSLQFGKGQGFHGGGCAQLYWGCRKLDDPTRGVGGAANNSNVKKECQPEKKDTTLNARLATI